PAGGPATCSAGSGIRQLRGCWHPSTESWRARRRCSSPSSCCRGPSPKRPPPKSTCRSSNTTCGSPTCVPRCSRSSPAGEMGADHDPHGPTLSQRPRVGGKEILALCAIGRSAPPCPGRAAAAAHRGHPHRRYELVEFLGGIRRALPQHPERISRPRTGQERAKSLDARGCQGGDRARRESKALEIGRGEL